MNQPGFAGRRLAHSPIILFAALTAVLVALAACSNSQASTGAPTPSPQLQAQMTASAQSTATAVALPPVRLGVWHDPTLGNIVVGPNGHTLYMYQGDVPGTSVCTGTCAQTWPPLFVDSSLTSTGVTGPLAVITRPNGSHQGTLNNMALYYFSGDATPHQIKGEGAHGLWYVLRPDGTAVLPPTGGASATSTESGATSSSTSTGK